MGRNTYLRVKVTCAACGWQGIRKDAADPCAKCGGALVAVSGHGGRTFDQEIGASVKAKNGKRMAATFGQDLMRGEHVVGEPKRKRAANALPSGGGGGGWKEMNEKMAERRAKLQAGSPAGLTFGEANMEGAPSTGTSIFDPVLCELAYRWFCPQGGFILDPFAGGSVRGIVAAMLGREYVGVDLRPEQVEANRVQAARICDEFMPEWYIGDSREVVPTLDVEADFVFSCPPYADLEVYSDDPRDLSTMGYAEFRAAYDEIIAAACAKLKADRFACFVVGDVRDAKGLYYGFPWHTIAAFEAAGLRLYNEAVLVTAAGSLPIRAGKQFATTRKLGKTHQNVLVFVKGDPKRATEAIGEVEFGEVPADEDAPLDGDQWGEQL